MNVVNSDGRTDGHGPTGRALVGDNPEDYGDETATTLMMMMMMAAEADRVMMSSAADGGGVTVVKR